MIASLANIVKKERFIFSIFASNFFLSFHYFLIIYINSTFLKLYFNPAGLSLVYVIGSVISLLLIVNSPKLLKRFGNYKLIVSFIFLEFLAVLGMSLAASPLIGQNILRFIPFFAGFLFVIHQAVIMMIIVNLDIFLEGASKAENNTGAIRGAYLTIKNLTVIGAPIIVSFILMNGEEFWKVYLLSAFITIPAFFISLKNFKTFKELNSINTKIVSIFYLFLQNKNLYKIFMAHLILNIFYAWMIIYAPIYMNEAIGFSWSTLAIIFTIMLLPFPIFQLPLGLLADKYFGEKEILTAGFIITAVSTVLLSFFTQPIFIVWAVALFMTRIGASFVEMAVESYFFKQINEENADLISFFRVAGPLSYILAALLASFALLFIDIRYLFIIIGGILLYGLKYSLTFKDTK